MPTRLRVAFQEDREVVSGVRKSWAAMRLYLQAVHSGLSENKKGSVKLLAEGMNAIREAQGQWRLRLLVWREPRKVRSSKSGFVKFLRKHGVKMERGAADRERGDVAVRRGGNRLVPPVVVRPRPHPQPPAEPLVNWGNVNIPDWAMLQNAVPAAVGNANVVAQQHDWVAQALNHAPGVAAPGVNWDEVFGHRLQRGAGLRGIANDVAEADED